MEDIIVGYFGSSSNESNITLPRVVKKRSVVIVVPRYNSYLSLICNFSSDILEPGENSFILYAYDVVNSEWSQSNTLAGVYVVLPLSWD